MDATKLDRIRKLLAQAEHPNTGAAEAEAFTDLAVTLMAKYGIEAAHLAAMRPETDLVTRLDLKVPGPYAVDKVTLLNAVARPFRVQVVMRQDTRSMSHAGCTHDATAKARGTCRKEREHSLTWSATLVGYQSDLDRCDLLFTSLLVQAAHAMAVARPKAPGESTSTYRKSWMAGFAAAVYRRLEAIERKAQDDSPTTGTDLVIADRNTAVANATRQMFPSLRYGKARPLKGSGVGAGYEAGERANLGTRNVGGTRGALEG